VATAEHGGLNVKNDDTQATVKVAKKSDVWHRVEAGTLFNVFYDTETTDLPKRFAEITQFGGVITDLAGNVLHTADYRGKPSGHAVFSPLAWVVQRMRAEDLDKGDPQYILAGKIMQFFRHASQLHDAPFSEKFLKQCRKNDDGDYTVPLQNNDGTTDWDSLKIQADLKHYAFRDPRTGNGWTTKKIGAMSIGYNNVNADDQWLWTTLHMAGAENVFVTHLPKLGKERLDVLRVVETSVLADAKTENAIKAAQAVHPITKEIYPSFRQGDILKANTRLDNEARGIAEGVTLPNGSHPDLSQLHGAFADALALAGIHTYLRRHNPNTLKELEQAGNWKSVVTRLTENENGFGDHPLMAYVDKNFPRLTGHMVTLIGTDQYRHNPKMALMFNLDVDPQTYRFNGKKLDEMDIADHAALIRHSRNDENAPYKVIYTHKTPRLLDKDKGFAAGFNKGLDENTLMKRARPMRKSSFIEKAMAGLRLAYPRLDGAERLILPQPEEELFTFPSVEAYDPQEGQDVQIFRPRNGMEKAAQDSRNKIMTVRKLWMKAIEPDEDILLGTNTQAAAKKFTDKIESLNKKLKDNNAPQIPAPDKVVTDTDSALQYKLKIMVFARQHFDEGNLKDIGHRYWFEDRYGHEIPEKELKSWNKWRFEEAIAGGDLNIRHEELNVTPPIIDRIFKQFGEDHRLGANVQNLTEATRRLRIHGIPHLGHDRQRWMTVEKALQTVEKLRNNDLTRADMHAIEERQSGAWSEFMTSNPDAQASLNECEAYLLKLLNETPFTAEDKLLVGIDPKTGHEIPNVRYPMKRENIVTLPVPDRYLDDSARDPVSNKPLWLVFNQKSPPKNVDVVLQAAATGKSYLLPKVKIVPVPPRGGVNDNFYKHAEARFADSGQSLPDPVKMTAMIGEMPAPLHNLRSINDNAQTLHIPKRHFEGLLDHKIASYPEKLTGIILRDDHLKVATGAVRLLETDKNDKPTGWEVETTIEKIQSLPLSTIKTFNDAAAQGYGYPTVDVMIDRVSEMYSNKQLDPNDPAHKVTVIDFGNIAPHSPVTGTMYYNPTVPKTAAIEPNVG
jgi:hypothetical protein